MEHSPRKGDASKDILENSNVYQQQDNVISWTNTPHGGSASWSAGCSNEHVGTISTNKANMGWSASFNKIGKSKMIFLFLYFLNKSIILLILFS